jgi:hypothetical protein
MTEKPSIRKTDSRRDEYDCFRAAVAMRTKGKGPLCKTKECCARAGIEALARVRNSEGLSRSDRFDPNEKDRLKYLNREQFLVNQMIPSDREML